MSNEDLGRVLSIQSHVAFGYVGNKAAVFPLQLLGFDVDVVNTVNFSNHSGYGRVGGSKTTAAELTSMFQNMDQNEVLNPDRLLTGYIPGAEALAAVADLVAKLKKQKPDLVYLLDPVMGDSGKLYVAPDVIPVYRNMLSYATIITPNWFEVEVLTKMELKDLSSLQLALKILHEQYNVPNVVISSIPVQQWLVDALPPHIRPSTSNSQSLLCIASSTTDSTLQSPNISSVHAGWVPLIPGYFSGVGDLFSSLLLAHFRTNSSDSVSLAASMALTKTYDVLCLTDKYAQALPEEERLPTDDEQDVKNPLRKIRRMKGRELRLIQSQNIIRGVELQEIRSMDQWNDFWKS